MMLQSLHFFLDMPSPTPGKMTLTLFWTDAIAWHRSGVLSDRGARRFKSALESGPCGLPFSNSCPTSLWEGAYLMRKKGLMLVVLTPMWATTSVLASWIYNPATVSEYRLTSPNIMWGDAEAEAVAAGGHLVAINSAAENA